MLRLGHPLNLLQAALAVAVCAGLLGACADPVYPQERFSPGRALPNPFSGTNNNDEVFSHDIGAMPLLTIDFPNQKGDQPVVHSVMDDIATLTSTPAPATQSAATAPSGDETPAAGKDDIKVADQQKPADKIVISRDNEANIDLWITSESGIGTVTLQRTGESWPSIVRLHLHYDKDKPFTKLEGLTASELAGEKQIPLKTTSDKDAGRGQVNIPAFSRAPQIQIQWVDVYR